MKDEVRSVEDNKKSSQVAVTTSEVYRVNCRRCGSSILKSDNYCSYCRKPNNDESRIKEVDLKVSILALFVSVLALIFTLSN